MQTDNRIDRTAEDVNDRPVRRPPVDILEDTEGLRILADMPGVDRDQIHIDLDRDRLTIRATRTDTTPSGIRVLAGQPLSFDYKRVFELTDAVDRDAIAANYKDGVLEIRLPRHERTKPRRIEINRG